MKIFNPFIRDKSKIKSFQWGLELIQAVKTLKEKGLITIDQKNRIAIIEDAIWNLNNDKQRKAWARNVAIYISSISETPDVITVQLMSKSNGKLLATFENDTAKLY